MNLTHDDAARLIDTDSEPGLLRLDPAVSHLTLTPDEARTLGRVLTDAAAVAATPKWSHCPLTVVMGRVQQRHVD